VEAANSLAEGKPEPNSARAVPIGVGETDVKAEPTALKFLTAMRTHRSNPRCTLNHFKTAAMLRQELTRILDLPTAIK
jgi:hypothetical protein